MDPVAISITHDAGKVSHLSESGARELLELMRAAIAGAQGDDSATITARMGEVHREWPLDGACRFAEGLARALALAGADHSDSAAGCPP